MKILGFTLIELIIVVAIIGVLGAIAIPSYRHYMVRSYLADAFTVLAAYQLQLEQYYQEHGNYGKNECGLANPKPLHNHFNYECQLANNGQNYTLTATSNEREGLSSYTYTTNNVGAQITLAFPDAILPAPCWLTRTTGC